MLVLTRKQCETIQIGDSITITVLRMKGKSVRLGIKAPHDLNVIRGELAFDAPSAEVVIEAAVESESTSPAAKTKARVNGSRQGAAWPTESAPAETGVGCAMAWSI